MDDRLWTEVKEEQVEKASRNDQYTSTDAMHNNLKEIADKVYARCDLHISDFETDTESKEYDACRSTMNGLRVVSRSAKITPKKIGQFVTLWKRSSTGPIQPYDQDDDIDLFLVNVRTDHALGQFVFPRSVLIEKGMVSTSYGHIENKD